jgi:hypothetical protein
MVEEKQRPPDVLKIQLNVPALERLIGGEREMEMILSQVAVDTVVSKRMEIVQKYVTEAVKRASDEILIRVVDENRYVPDYVLSDKLKDVLNKLVKKETETLVSSYIETNREAIYQIIRNVIAKEEIDKSIKWQAKEVLKEMIDKAFKEKE